MPQMSPYNWLILFLMFNMIMMFLISYNHFMMYKFINIIPHKLKKNNFIWMW